MTDDTFGTPFPCDACTDRACVLHQAEVATGRAYRCYYRRSADKKRCAKPRDDDASSLGCYSIHARIMPKCTEPPRDMRTAANLERARAAIAAIAAAGWQPDEDAMDIINSLHAGRPGDNIMNEWNAIDAALPEPYTRVRNALSKVRDFERDPNTTKDDVLAVFDRAIATLRESVHGAQTSLFAAAP